MAFAYKMVYWWKGGGEDIKIEVAFAGDGGRHPPHPVLKLFISLPLTSEVGKRLISGEGGNQLGSASSGLELGRGWFFW